MIPVVVTAGDVTVTVKTRSIIVAGTHTTTKIFTDPAVAEREQYFYQLVPWACPELVDHGRSHIMTPTYPTAAMQPNWKPAHLLFDLLLQLQSAGVHHRDVHVHNVVRGPYGPLLIDWESAVHDPTFKSYDIYGPYESGLTPPQIHEELIPQFWNSRESSSILNRWGIDVFELVRQAVV